MGFVLKTLTDQESGTLLIAYNSLKERRNMLNGVGSSKGENKKIALIKRLTNKPFDLTCQCWNKLIEFFKWHKQKEEFDNKIKSKILKGIMDRNLRLLATGFRQSYQFMEADRKKEQDLIYKQRGIMRKILDVNARLTGMGFN